MESVEELEAFFKQATLPTGPIQLTPGVKIIDLDKMLATSYATIKANPNSPMLLNARIDDLTRLKALIS
jgi:hypothetical protein